MELNTYKLTKVGLGKNDIMLATFLLLHGIAVARKRYPYFRHRDIHPGNVMIMLRTPKGKIRSIPDITVALPSDDSVQFTVPDVIYLPKIIDFGESRFEQKPGKYDNPDESWESFEDVEETRFKPRNDIVRLRELILALLKVRRIQDIFIDEFFWSPEYQAATKAERDDYKTIETLLMNPLFSEYDIAIKTPQEMKKRRKENINCMICASPDPTKVYSTNHDYRFCNEYCEQRYEVFRNFLPKK